MIKYFTIVFKVSFVSVLILALFAPTLTTQAADFRYAKNREGNLVILSQELHNNLYAVGNSVIINAPVTGDLILAGGSVTIEGDIEEDLMVAGGDVYVNGKVGGDVRVVGGRVTFNQPIAGDVLVLAGTMIFKEQSSIGGDLIAYSDHLVLDASVAGELKVNSISIVINSSITGHSDIKAQSVVFGNQAFFATKSKYESPRQAEVYNGAQVDNVEFVESAMAKQDNKGFFGLISLKFFLKIILLIAPLLLLILILPRLSNLLVVDYEKSFGPNIGIGLLAFIVMPIMAVVLMFTVIGLVVGVLVLLLWILLIIFALLLGMGFAGAWLVRWFSKQEVMDLNWQAVIVGVVAVSILGQIPYVGPLVCFLLFLTGFGVIIRYIHSHIRTQ